ncbi:MAG: hypothetical protein HYT09_01355 [Candidatus Levybacteria bacterium]|nr:hypothetical protein [Candidatus Levybacteria bacterium]
MKSFLAWLAIFGICLAVSYWWYQFADEFVVTDFYVGALVIFASIGLFVVVIGVGRVLDFFFDK